MGNSTFAVNTYCSDFTSTVSSQYRFAQSIKHGAIPIVFGTKFEFPFAEILDWSKAAIQVPINSMSNIQVPCNVFCLFGKLLHCMNSLWNILISSNVTLGYPRLILRRDCFGNASPGKSILRNIHVDERQDNWYRSDNRATQTANARTARRHFLGNH